MTMKQVPADTLRGSGMAVRAARRFGALLAVACAMSGCAAYKSGMGTDLLSHSEAEFVAWTDGAPAVSITCLEPHGCGQRARAICMPRGLKILKHPESAADHSNPPSVIVRCG